MIKYLLGLMKKISIVELLKDCPRGMELDCTICDNVYFDEVTPADTIKCFIKNDTTYNVIHFHRDGSYLSVGKAKCVIFPKGKTTWEGFQIPFKDGDIIATKSGRWIGITAGGESKEVLPTYCVLKPSGNLEASSDNIERMWKFDRLATEEEKAKLFQAIKANGYRWNAETKTLEKLVEPKFKDGEILSNGICICIYNGNENDNCYGMYVGVGNIDFPNYFNNRPQNNYFTKKNARLATEEEKQKLFDAIKANGYKWNAETKTLEKLVEPRFKVGDRVKEKISYISGIITEIDDDSYRIEYAHGGIAFASIKFQDNLELVPNKFDITTLKPFDKVLVRGNVGQKWIIDFFGFMDKDKGCPFVCVGHYISQCIPYEENKHLLDTINDCDDFYKTWEN